ncbi:hypothetical protein M9458_008291, partial [Cirrhinus mrigala]
ACFLTLDPNTAYKRLNLSEDNRKPYPDHADRFDISNYQVLCRESVCGRCYWEIEWSGDCVDIAVSYKSISRKGGDAHSDTITNPSVIDAGTLSFYSVSDTVTLIHTEQTTFTQHIYAG